MTISKNSIEMDTMKLIVLKIIFGMAVFGAETPPPGALVPERPIDTEEIQLKLKARKRLYAGGQDEEPLRVQQQLSQPTRKIGPATEALEPVLPNESDD